MSFRSWAGIALVIFVIGVLALIVWGIRGLVSAVPTPSDLVEAFEPEPYEEIGPVVISSIRDMAELTTVEAVEYTIVEKGTDQGWLAWARGDSIQLFAVARIGAGVDLSEMSVRDALVDTEEGVVELMIPRAEIQYVEVDNEATQILDRSTGVFTRGDPRLETDARQIADEILRESAIEGGLLERAEESARQVLTDFLLSLGYRDVVIEFES